MDQIKTVVHAWKTGKLMDPLGLIWKVVIHSIEYFLQSLADTAFKKSQVIHLEWINVRIR